MVIYLELKKNANFERTTAAWHIYDTEEYFCVDLTLASLVFPVTAFESVRVKPMSNCQYLWRKWAVLQLHQIGIGF